MISQICRLVSQGPAASGAGTVSKQGSRAAAAYAPPVVATASDDGGMAKAMRRLAGIQGAGKLKL